MQTGGTIETLVDAGAVVTDSALWRLENEALSSPRGGSRVSSRAVTPREIGTPPRNPPPRRHVLVRTPDDESRRLTAYLDDRLATRPAERYISAGLPPLHLVRKAPPSATLPGAMRHLAHNARPAWDDSGADSPRHHLRIPASMTGDRTVNVTLNVMPSCGLEHQTRLLQSRRA